MMAPTMGPFTVGRHVPGQPVHVSAGDGGGPHPCTTTATRTRLLREGWAVGRAV